MKVEDVDTLTLPGYLTGVSFVAGAKIQYVSSSPPKRRPCERAAHFFAGVLASDVAALIGVSTMDAASSINEPLDPHPDERRKQTPGRRGHRR